MGLSIVLIVHPDPGTRTSLASALASEGCAVVVAETFADARRLLHEVQPTLVVAPLKLGTHNAVHLALLTRAYLPGSRVVILGYADPVLEREAAAAGATYLTEQSADRVIEIVVEAAKSATRRWPRATVDLEARVASKPVRLMDVSYGGFRFAVPRSSIEELQDAFALVIGDVRVTATPVWQREIEDNGEAAWYGAAVKPTPEEADAWHALVDAALDGTLRS